MPASRALALALARARTLRRFAVGAAAALLAAAGLVTTAPAPAQAAGEPVSIWLTSTSDSGGRTVTRGLQKQDGPSSANGTRLQIWDCAGTANQQWTLPG